MNKQARQTDRLQVCQKVRRSVTVLTVFHQSISHIAQAEVCCILIRHSFSLRYHHQNSFTLRKKGDVWAARNLQGGKLCIVGQDAPQSTAQYPRSRAGAFLYENEIQDPQPNEPTQTCRTFSPNNLPFRIFPENYCCWTANLIGFLMASGRGGEMVFI